VSLFGEAGRTCRARLAVAEDWMPAERLAEEHHAVGFYLSGHPLDDYAMAVDDVVSDAAAAGLRVFVAEERALNSVKIRLEEAKAGARRRGGPVELIVSDPDLGAEIEIALPGEWPVTPQVMGAIKAAPGVSHVEAF
jgi:DNA polymerase III alpha subunit